jgi:hypothetical protein
MPFAPSLHNDPIEHRPRRRRSIPTDDSVYDIPIRHHRCRRPPDTPCLKRPKLSSIVYPSALLMEPGLRKSLILVAGGMGIHPK